MAFGKGGLEWHWSISLHPGQREGPVWSPRGWGRDSQIPRWTWPVLPRPQGRGWFWGSPVVQEGLGCQFTLALAHPPVAPLLQYGPGPLPSLTPQPSPITSLQTCHFSNISSTSSLRALSRALSSSQNCCSSTLSGASSSLSSRSQLDCHLLRKTFLTSSKVGTLGVYIYILSRDVT